MAFLRPHLICMGLLVCVVAVLNAEIHRVTHPPVKHTYRVTGPPHIHRHTHKTPGRKIKHVHHHKHSNNGEVDLSGFGSDSYSSGSSYSDSSYSDSSAYNYSSYSDSGAIPAIPVPTPAPVTPAPATPAPETPAPETPAPATPAPATPAPETPAPATPAPATPAPETPAPATPAPATPTPEPSAPATLPPDSSYSTYSVSSDSYSSYFTGSYPSYSVSSDPYSSYSDSVSYPSYPDSYPSYPDSGSIPPTPAPVCGKNEEYTECGTSCPLTCENKDNPPEGCIQECVDGCVCRKGYVKNSEGECITPEECKETPPAPAGSCPLPTPVEAFSASVITSRLLFTDNATLNLELSGDEAALKLYKTIKAVLEDYGVCNADSVAFSGARGFANAEKVTVLDYIKTASVAFGTTLYNHGVLSCNNDVSLGLSLFRFIQKALKDRDQSTFDNQFHGVVKGIVDLYVSLGLDLGDITQDTSDVFAQQFLGGNKCKAKQG